MFLAQMSCINLFHVQDSDDEDQNVPAGFLSLEKQRYGTSFPVFPPPLSPCKESSRRGILGRTFFREPLVVIFRLT